MCPEGGLGDSWGTLMRGVIGALPWDTGLPAPCMPFVGACAIEQEMGKLTILS